MEHGVERDGRLAVGLGLAVSRHRGVIVTPRGKHEEERQEGCRLGRAIHGITSQSWETGHSPLQYLP